MEYADFVAAKFAAQPPTGIPDAEPSCAALFAFQRDLVRWALRRGRAALFCDCGLGKSLMELSWAHEVAAHVGKPVLILTPLAVAPQFVREGAKFAVPCVYAREPSSSYSERVVVTNYERLDRFDPADFAGVVLDEASILKSLDGKTRALLTEKFAGTRFRLAASATPAPNDHAELGNQAEFLGICTRVEMLAEFFNRDGGSTQDWELKGHARAKFWAWVTQWACAVRTPSDLGYADDGYVLPPLTVASHVVEVDDSEVAREAGLLFAMPAAGLTEQRAAKRASIGDRVAALARLVMAEPTEQWLLFCDLNDEGDALTAAIDGAVQVAGSDDQDAKERALLDFAECRLRVLVTKSKIAGLGLNLQSCARIGYVGVNHSFEAFFQSVRRCWRFGQERPVHVHVVCSSRETEVLENLRRKEASAQSLMASMVATMRDYQLANVRGSQRVVNDYAPTKRIRMPKWLVEGV